LNALLEVDHISKSFRGLVAVRDLSFAIDKGEILGLIGPNGAGKTTAFNMVAGINKPDSGVVRFSGNVISGLKPHKISQLGVARTFQIVKPFARMTTIENVVVGSLYGRNHALWLRNAKPLAREALRYAGLESKEEVLAGQLTLAEQRRLELARALASNPQLLMLDEIMAGLNSTEIVQTLDLLRRLNKERGIALLVIEHVMLAIMQLCGRIVVMNQGEKLAEGTPSEIVSDDKVIEAYMGKKKVNHPMLKLEQKGKLGEEID
jgi:branched-chain amino acid transport system ATP-binding protein